jgi:hypothetical protein
MYSLWEGVPYPVEFSQLAPLNQPDPDNLLQNIAQAITQV